MQFNRELPQDPRPAVERRRAPMTERRRYKRIRVTLNVPVILTLLRVALIPLFVLVFYLPFNWAYPASAGVFLFAGITDWLDGYLARRWQQISAFGAFLDPVADKLMVAAALVMLVGKQSSVWLAVPAIVIIGREIAVSALREFMAEMGQRGIVAVSFTAKVKTTCQILALLLLLYHRPFFGLPSFILGMILIYAAAGLTLWSMAFYLRAAWRTVDVE
jgi:CDP-diacylglycerol--glycerol-3-phosphate 3-phosphatidyltransferase